MDRKKEGKEESKKQQENNEEFIIRKEIYSDILQVWNGSKAV